MADEIARGIVALVDVALFVWFYVVLVVWVGLPELPTVGALLAWVLSPAWSRPRP